jgi:glycosyltransferase involved in cell wall biosynthesis
MNILYVSGGLQHGGSQAIAQWLAVEMAGQGHLVSVVNLGAAGEGSAQLTRAGVDVKEVDGLRTISGLLVALNIWCWIIKGRYDLVHCHLVGSTVFAWPAFCRRRTQWITTYHGALAGWRARAACGLARLQQGVVAVSPSVRNLLIDLGIPQDRISVIYNGAPGPPASSVTSVPWPTGDPIIGCVGHISSYKGQIDLVRATPALLARFPHVVVVLIGEGPDTERVEREAAHLAVSSHVCQLGRRSDVVQLMRHFSLTVIPSHTEGFNLTMIESMSVGKPVVATRCGGPEDVIKPEFGLLVPVANPKTLAEGIIDLLGSDISKMGDAGRAVYAEQFSLSRMAGNYGDLYRTLSL